MRLLGAASILRSLPKPTPTLDPSWHQAQGYPEVELLVAEIPEALGSSENAKRSVILHRASPLSRNDSHEGNTRHKLIDNEAHLFLNSTWHELIAATL